MSGHANPEPVVKVQGLCKSFGHRRALIDLDLTVEAGRTVTVFGHNGAGKTTLMRCIVGLTRPTAGRVLLWERSGHEPEVAGRLGLLGHESMTYRHLTARENLRFFAAQYGIDDADERIDRLVADFGLEAHAEEPASTLSRGLLQRLSLARSVVHDPDLLILDEPFTGLDQTACRLLQERLSRWHGAGKTIILTTHQTDLGLACCTHVAVLASGRLVLAASRDEIDEAAFRDDYVAYARSIASAAAG